MSLLSSSYHYSYRNQYVAADAQVVGLESRSDAETRAMLHGIVRHYQTLFDVPNVVGVYASMSVVYRKLSEAHTVLTTLKDHLDLGKLELLYMYDSHHGISIISN